MVLGHDPLREVDSHVRKRWVQHPKTGKLIPEEEVDFPRRRNGIRARSFQIMPDIEPFVSPVDGTVVSSRSVLREHNARNDVVNFHEFDGEWEAMAAKRQAILDGTDKETKADRIADVVAAVDKAEGKKP